MKKLELKHQNIICQLSGSPDIEILNYKCDYVGIKTAKSNGFYYIGDDLYITYAGGYAGKKIGDECKLHLHPLSSLTKPIKVEGYNDGKEFVPIVELLKLKYPEHITNNDGTKYVIIDFEIEGHPRAHFRYSANRDIIIRPHGLKYVEYWIIKLLYQWLFDIERLIESGLAIDIKTL